VCCFLCCIYIKGSPYNSNEAIRVEAILNLSDSIITFNTDTIPVFKIRLINSKDQKINIFMIKSGVEVIGYDGVELKIESSDYVPPSSQKDGLKPLYNKTEDNTRLGLSVVRENNEVKITQASIDPFRYKVFVPNNISLSYEEVGDQGADLSISNINGEIEIKLARGNASLLNVAGPIVANSERSNFKVVFSIQKSNKPCAFSSIRGSVDIALPAQNASDLQLRSVNGEIYTDFAIVIDSSANLPTLTGGHNIHGKINGGGAQLTVHTVYNNIFIRKRK
jgi:hypothetical protein